MAPSNSILRSLAMDYGLSQKITKFKTSYITDTGLFSQTGILYTPIRMEVDMGGQVGQDWNDDMSVHGLDGPPSHKPGQYQGRSRITAARVYEARLERAAHSNSPSLQR